MRAVKTIPTTERVEVEVVARVGFLPAALADAEAAEREAEEADLEAAEEKEEEVKKKGRMECRWRVGGKRGRQEQAKKARTSSNKR